MTPTSHNPPRRSLFRAAPVAAAALALSSLGACAMQSSGAPENVAGTTWQFGLVGAQEVPGPGDAAATGFAKVTVDTAANTVCADVTVKNLTDLTAAHIHSGAKGVAGPPVVTLEVPVNGASSQCYPVTHELAAAISADPQGYYLNVHNKAHPSGAIRGQLKR